MRIEQIIAAVTRSVVNATVREIQAAVSFVDALRLHLWLERMPLGMPAYASSLSHLPSIDGMPGRIDTGKGGSKPGRLQLQPMLAVASCPTGTVKA
jgi:hypothetical protein